jgi:hypothetical protein
MKVQKGTITARLPSMVIPVGLAKPAATTRNSYSPARAASLLTFRAQSRADQSCRDVSSSPPSEDCARVAEAGRCLRRCYVLNERLGNLGRFRGCSLIQSSRCRAFRISPMTIHE